MAITWTERQPGGAANFNWQTSATSSDGSVIYAAIYGGRIWKSTDYGANWTEVRPKGDVNANWFSIACSADGTKVIVCDRDVPGRIYLSTDSGANFSEVRPAGDVDKDWRVVDCDNDASVLLAAVFGGRAYISVNGGTDWNEIQPAGNLDKDWYCLSCNSDGSKIVAAVYAGRVYLSSNTGANWAETYPAGAIGKNWRIADISKDGNFIVIGASSGRLYTTPDFGANWTERRPNSLNNDYFWQLAVCDEDGSRVLVGVYGFRLYQSVDFGVTWEETRPAGDLSKNWRLGASNYLGGRLVAGVYGGRLYTGYESLSSSSSSSRSSSSSSSQSSVSISSSSSSSFSLSSSSSSLSFSLSSSSSSSSSYSFSLSSSSSSSSSSYSMSSSSSSLSFSLSSSSSSSLFSESVSISSSSSSSFSRSSSSSSRSSSSESSSSSSAFPWLVGWNRRKDHIINGSQDGNLTDYQMEIDVFNESGEDAAGVVYVNGYAKTDMSDIRFTTENNVLLKHWADGVEAYVSPDTITKKITASIIAADGSIYAGDGVGSIWRSTNGGITWTIELTLNSVTAGFLMIWQAADGSIYAAPHGGATITSDDAGLWRKKDGNWTRVIAFAANGAGQWITIWGIDEDQSGRVFAATYTGGGITCCKVYRSVDGGDSWTVVYSSAYRHIHDLKIDRYHSPNAIYITQDNFEGGVMYLHKCSDSSQATPAFNRIFPDGGIQLLPIVITPTARVFLSDGAGAAGTRIFRTTDDLTLVECFRSTSRCMNFYAANRNPITGYLYGFIHCDASGGSPFVPEILYSNDDGKTWRMLTTFHDTASPAGQGIGFQWASNWVNNICYVSKKTSIDGYVNGIKLIDGVKRKFYVKIDFIPQSAEKLIRIYYENPSAVDSIDPTTFIDFDHFNSLDTSKWTEITDPDCVRILANSTIKFTANLTPAGLNRNAGIQHKTTFATPIAIIALINSFGRAAGNKSLFGFRSADLSQDAALLAYGLNPGEATLWTRRTSSQFGIITTAYRSGLWTIKMASSIVKLLRISPDISDSATLQIPNVSTYPWIGISIPSVGGQFAGIEVDWIAVRKFTVNEPTDGAWSAEEYLSSSSSSSSRSSSSSSWSSSSKSSSSSSSSWSSSSKSSSSSSSRSNSSSSSSSSSSFSISSSSSSRSSSSSSSSSICSSSSSSSSCFSSSSKSSSSSRSSSSKSSSSSSSFSSSSSSSRISSSSSSSRSSSSSSFSFSSSSSSFSLSLSSSSSSSRSSSSSSRSSSSSSSSSFPGIIYDTVESAITPIMERRSALPIQEM